MQVKISKILDLKAIYEKIKSKNLPIKTAYKFSKIFNAVEENFNFDNDELNKILQKYAEKDENGNFKTLENNKGIQVSKEYISKAQSELNSLMNLEVDFPDITFKIDELGTIELSIEEITCLEIFIEQ